MVRCDVVLPLLLALLLLAVKTTLQREEEDEHQHNYMVFTSFTSDGEQVDVMKEWLDCNSSERGRRSGERSATHLNRIFHLVAVYSAEDENGLQKVRDQFSAWKGVTILVRNSTEGEGAWVRARGSDKWDSFSWLLWTHGHLLNRYGRLLLLDSNVRMACSAIELLFLIMHGHHLTVAAPSHSLEWHSYRRVNAQRGADSSEELDLGREEDIMKRHPECDLRYTNFVPGHALGLDSAALQACEHIFHAAAAPFSGLVSKEDEGAQDAYHLFRDHENLAVGRALAACLGQETAEAEAEAALFSSQPSSENTERRRPHSISVIDSVVARRWYVKRGDLPPSTNMDLPSLWLQKKLHLQRLQALASALQQPHYDYALLPLNDHHHNDEHKQTAHQVMTEPLRSFNCTQIHSADLIFSLYGRKRRS